MSTHEPVVDVRYECGCETGFDVSVGGAFVHPCALHRTETDPVHSEAVRRKVEDLCHEIGRLRQELLHTEGDLAVAVHEARVAREAVERVRALHVAEDVFGITACERCRVRWPCSTAEALEGVK